MFNRFKNALYTAVGVEESTNFNWSPGGVNNQDTTSKKVPDATVKVSISSPYPNKEYLIKQSR